MIHGESFYDLMVMKLIGASMACFGIILQIEGQEFADLLSVKSITSSGILLAMLVYFIRLSEKMAKEHKEEMKLMKDEYEKKLEEKEKEIKELYNKISDI